MGWWPTSSPSNASTAIEQIEVVEGIRPVCGLSWSLIDCPRFDHTRARWHCPPCLVPSFLLLWFPLSFLLSLCCLRVPLLPLRGCSSSLKMMILVALKAQRPLKMMIRTTRDHHQMRQRELAGVVGERAEDGGVNEKYGCGNTRHHPQGTRSTCVTAEVKA
jgi:hypothetical protein